MDSRNELTPIEPETKDAAEDVLAFKKDILSSKSKLPVDIDVNYEPKNPYVTTLPGGFQSSPDIHGVNQTPGFFQTAKAEAADWNATYQGIHAAYNQYEKVNPLDDIAPPDWTPKSDVQKFVNIQSQYLNYVLEATGPKDQDYRIQRVYGEQAHDETLKNGSFLAKLLGGFVGAVTDPMSYIPVAGWVKYAKFAPTFIRSVGRALPGVASYSLLSSAAEQSNKINGNLVDFVTDSFIKTSLGTVLFGGVGVVGLATEKMELWSLNKLAKEGIDGIGFKLATNKEGIVTGFKAVDETGSLSAAKVNFAQDIANSSFSKMGVFKVPYVGAGVEKLLGMPFFGTPLIRLFNSPFQTVKAVIDRVADHNFITEGVKEGEVTPRKFTSLMNQEFAQLRALHAQMEALRLERNGFETQSRVLGGIVNLGLNIKDKTLKALSDNVDKTNYLTREDFFDEVRQVMQSRVSSPHSSVNEAASQMRKQYDSTWEAMKKAYNLGDTWIPKEALEGFISRVYNTPYMNTKEDEFINKVGGWLEESDLKIQNIIRPIESLEQQIKDFSAKHTQAVRILGNLDAKRIASGEVDLIPIEHGITLGEAPEKILPGKEVATADSVNQLSAMKARLRTMKEELQNHIRDNVGDYFYHVDDWNALSADEAKEIAGHTKKLNSLKQDIEKQKAEISAIKAKRSKILSRAKEEAVIQKAIPKSKKYVEVLDEVKQAEDALKELQDKHDLEYERLQEKMHSGQIDNRLFIKKPNSFQYEFKDPSNRLKFRELYNTEKNPYTAKSHAKAWYKTIMHQNAEDTINQVMGRVRGLQRENPLMERSVLVPDSVIKEFLSKDLMASVSNYTTYLARRTHLKNIFKDVSIDGGFEPVLEMLNTEHEQFRTQYNEQKSKLEEKLAKPDLTDKEKRKVDKDIAKVDKLIEKKSKEFKTAKSDLSHIYDKMMGIDRLSPKDRKWKNAIMSITAMVNLPFVPFTMINDVSAIGLQHGLWPFIRDGVEPIITSLGGLLKGKNSEALRKSAPSVHLALQDVLNGYADRNFSSQNNPYLNLGKIVQGLETVAHSATNFTLTNYLDNGLQHISGAVVQSEIMRILHAFKANTATPKELMYVIKYGIDPKVWADRMIQAFKDSRGGKTHLGGYRSNFWRWADIDASNEFGDAVFRGIKDTQIQSGIADSPFWTDSLLGTIIKGFNGWTFASLNRYVIPSLQQPDAQKLVGVAFMLATGALVSPMRRMARGETAYPDGMTNKQLLWQTIQDSGYFSWFTTMLADANLLTGDRLLGDLKNDKYKDRTRAGLLGPSWGTANRMADVITALGTGEWNEADAKKAARMIPYANASWTYWMSEKVMLGLSRAAQPNLPKTRYQAHLRKH